MPPASESTDHSPCWPRKWPWQQQDPNYNTGSASYTRGHANNIDVEEAQDQPGNVMGTLLVNSVPATVLFDSGASHSFMSEAFALSHNFTLEKMHPSMAVRTPIGQC